MNTIRLGLEWFLNPDHAPFLIAEEKGWFREAGLLLDLIEPASHLDAMEAIEKGELDVAITEPIHLVIDAAKGKSVIGFARFLHTNGGVMYLKGRGIERPRDMAGKRVQYPGAPDPGGLAIIRTMIEADGGEKDAPLTPVNNSFYHTDALAQDKADVATLIFYNFEIIEARNRGLDADFFALKDWGVPDFCQLILITSQRNLEERSKEIKGLLKVLRKSIDFIHQHPDESKLIYFKRTNTVPDDSLSNAIYNATVPCFTFDFMLAKEYWENLQNWLCHTQQIKQAPENIWYWTNKWVL
ncbi:MAG: ABC transporter substrate-binding protein [Chloroherpetonaceae bacterium]|nr:ABC transporter substrate-binding protein [Chloroherpetonaceae bacterium]MCS7212008.1 ABC transporter substrate-binding protein [Chloroherpetonaceae bacterium]MDW8019134.1 ABC transporter substrate-binding protein [Chloroherpetonaceae bacterium]MDW8466921.1 ABC transporter substrate-binding protein [Chloroherpetonaceae bacterium]